MAGICFFMEFGEGGRRGIFFFFFFPADILGSIWYVRNRIPTHKTLKIYTQLPSLCACLLAVQLG